VSCKVKAKKRSCIWPKEREDTWSFK